MFYGAGRIETFLQLNVGQSVVSTSVLSDMLYRDGIATTGSAGCEFYYECVVCTCCLLNWLATECVCVCVCVCVYVCVCVMIMCGFILGYSVNMDEFLAKASKLHDFQPFGDLLHAYNRDGHTYEIYKVGMCMDECGATQVIKAALGLVTSFQPSLSHILIIFMPDNLTRSSILRFIDKL